MGKVRRVHYELNDVSNLIAPSEEDINNILRCADEIIASAGRSMLVKMLKGSKDKKLLEQHLELCPSYGYYKDITMNKIAEIVDWMILNDYLELEYFYRLPMVVFSSKGWETYKPYYVDELYAKVLTSDLSERELLIERLKTTNREVVLMLLTKIAASKNIGVIRFLEEWKSVEVRKVREKIDRTISKIKSK